MQTIEDVPILGVSLQRCCKIYEIISRNKSHFVIIIVCNQLCLIPTSLVTWICLGYVIYFNDNIIIIELFKTITMSIEQNIRTFKDFLIFYNLMSQTCFSHCINTFKRSNVEEDEAQCIERCATKLIRFNNRSIGVYAELQQNLMEKRMAEAEKEALAAQTKLDAEAIKEVSQEANALTPTESTTNLSTSDSS